MEDSNMEMRWNEAKTELIKVPIKKDEKKLEEKKENVVNQMKEKTPEELEKEKVAEKRFEAEQANMEKRTNESLYDSFSRGK